MSQVTAKSGDGLYKTAVLIRDRSGKEIDAVGVKSAESWKTGPLIRMGNDFLEIFEEAITVAMNFDESNLSRHPTKEERSGYPYSSLTNSDVIRFLIGALIEERPGYWFGIECDETLPGSSRHYKKIELFDPSLLDESFVIAMISFYKSGCIFEKSTTFAEKIVDPMGKVYYLCLYLEGRNAADTIWTRG